MHSSDGEIDINEEFDIPAVRFNRETGQLEDAGKLTLAKMMEGFSMWHQDIVEGQVKFLLERGLITETQKAQIVAHEDLKRNFFIQSSQHDIGLRALADKVVTIEDLLSMNALQLDYLTAQRETTDYTKCNHRTFDGVGIILLREKFLTVAEYKQLPLCHLEALFNGRSGEGLYAFQKGVICFADIMQFPEEKFEQGKNGRLAEFVSQKLSAYFKQEDQIKLNH